MLAIGWMYYDRSQRYIGVSIVNYKNRGIDGKYERLFMGKGCLVEIWWCECQITGEQSDSKTAIPHAKDDQIYSHIITIVKKLLEG